MGAPQKYVVTDEAGIDIDGARAYNPGDEIAADVVARYELQDRVSRPGTKAAEAAADTAVGA